MTARRTGIAILLALLAWPGRLPGQAPAEEPAPPGLPAFGEVLKAIDRASAPEGDKAREWSAPIKLAVVFAFLAILPTVLIMMTSFTRIVIVLAFIRRALTTQNIPPTIAIVGLGLLLTLFTMSPVLGRINEEALRPYMENRLGFGDACLRGHRLLKAFMIRQTRSEDLKLFVQIARSPVPESLEDLPAHVVISSFAISEFRTAFKMGCLVFVPFLVIDLVVAGILLSAGMMMLPPAMISLPIKMILFVLVDGWRLLAESLVTSFR